MADLTYLYAVARDPLPSCPPGILGGGVRTVAHAGLVAYVSTVPPERFGEEPLRRSLEDMDWLAETARAHHRVVDFVAAATTTAPVRLVTVYEDDGQVVELLSRRGNAFQEMLANITGRHEWGVKAYATTPAAPTSDESAASGPGSGEGAASEPGLGSGEDAVSGTHDGRRAAAPQMNERAATSGAGEKCAGRQGARDGHAGRSRSEGGHAVGATRPGTAYLHRRRAGLRGREQARRQALQRADHIHRALCALAAAGHRHRAQDPRLSGRDDVMLLNGAYLVDEARADEFAELAGTLGGDGVEIRLTGPWAPYSFTVMEPA
ncbi:GvpL/GvpF family gas vesicle protein [Nonomuraea sp. NPDC050404]|uniref:GvpL/GvpF family gas vesicle protein n=1 Tax=Nonomuraea sp. NPDC050404 TaxID=3155783 RepID=UPI0033FD20EA